MKPQISLPRYGTRTNRLALAYAAPDQRFEGFPLLPPIKSSGILRHMKPRLATVRAIGNNRWKISPYRYGAGFETFTLTTDTVQKLDTELAARNILAV